MATTTVKVFIASSAEVKEERDKCIFILNQINKSHTHIDIEPIEWEYDMVAGNNPGFDTVQKKINPLLEESTLCLFIFNSKIGKYTLEEFKLVNKLKKKFFIFFKEGFSPKTKDAIEKWTELLSFKESMNDTVLYKDYNDLKDFELLLKDNLNLYLSQEFPPTISYENKPLSPEVSTLLKVLNEKQEEIEELKKANLAIPDAETKNKLAALEQEKNELINELNQNKEIQQQQAKEKQELETRLATQVAKDNLKQQALAAIQEKNYDEAEFLLKESAKDTISEPASTFYELGKLKKIQLNYQKALYYFNLAVNLKPDDFEMNREAGSMLRDSGYNDKAIIHFENALQILKQNNPDDESNLSYLYNELGWAFDNKGEYNKAIEYYEKAIVIGKKLYGEEHPDIATDYNNLGLAYDSKSEYDKALEYYEKALAIYKKYYGDEHPHIATGYNNLGAVYLSKGEYDKAIEYYERGLSIDKKFYGEEHPDIATRYNNLGTVYRSKGEYDKAIEYYEKALAIDKKFNADEHPDIATRYFGLGYVYTNKGEYDKAIEYYEKSLSIFKKFLPANHPSIATVTKNLANAREAQKSSQKK